MYISFVLVRGAVLSSKEARELGMSYLLQFNYQHKNVLYEPLTGNLAKVVKEANIKVTIVMIYFNQLFKKSRFCQTTLLKKTGILYKTRAMIAQCLASEDLSG